MSLTRIYSMAMFVGAALSAACSPDATTPEPNLGDASSSIGAGDGSTTGAPPTVTNDAGTNSGTNSGAIDSGAPTSPPRDAATGNSGSSDAGPAAVGAADSGSDSAVSSDAGAMPGAAGAGCTPAPTGSFMTKVVTRTGPDSNYTIFRPATLGESGFKHPPVAWGNGLGTTPDQYTAWLTKVAANGFVVIANPGTGSDPQVVRKGLEWLIAQGAGAGDYAGKLAEHCAGTFGYSMGGGAAVGSGSHPDVRAVVSVHGLQDASDKISGPLLLTTSDDDGFVTPEGYVQPCYDKSSKQPTIMATYITGNEPSFSGHLTPIGDGKQDADPSIAWLRLWLYGDQAQKKWFYGADCTLCVKPWGKIQRKNGSWD